MLVIGHFSDYHLLTNWPGQNRLYYSDIFVSPRAQLGTSQHQDDGSAPPEFMNGEYIVNEVLGTKGGMCKRSAEEV
jgi:hypothetical protein